MASRSDFDTYTSAQSVLAQAQAARRSKPSCAKEPVNVGKAAVLTAKVATVAAVTISALYAGYQIYSYFCDPHVCDDPEQAQSTIDSLQAQVTTCLAPQVLPAVAKVIQFAKDGTFLIPDEGIQFSDDASTYVFG
ncbi:MAG: hypothetical protein S4CHLAM37_06100 [Chlamydiia bacterium]|nr:hypothetical protein [Chlamydiia bacterium]